MNDNQIRAFENEQFGQVRTVIKDGEPWFVANDVCRVLELSNTSMALQRLGDDEKSGISLTDPHGRTQITNVVNEPGLYVLVLASRKPEAKAFKRWITHDVLPSLRKHGGYLVGQENMTPEEMMAHSLLYAQSLIEEKTRLLSQAQGRITELEEGATRDKQAIAIMEPKARYCDKVLSCSNAVPTTVIAKDYGMSARRLNEMLSELRVQYRCGRMWVLYQEHADKGYTKTETVVCPNGQAAVSMKWTQKGRMFLYELLKGEDVLPVMEAGA